MQKKNDKNGRKNATKQTLTKENSQKEQTQSLQSISFDGEERQRLARQDRKIYLSDLETRRANIMPNSIPISSRHYRFVDRSIFQCGSLYKGWRPALVSVVAENRKPCPPTKKKRHQIRSKRNSSKNFRCVPIGAPRQWILSLRDPYEKYTWSVRAVTAAAFAHVHL